MAAPAVLGFGALGSGCFVFFFRVSSLGLRVSATLPFEAYWFRV